MSSESEIHSILCRSRWDHRPDRAVPVTPDETLFQALKRAGIPVASSCHGGVVCGRCVVRVLEGEAALSSPDEEETRVLHREQVGPDERLACRTRSRAQGVVITTGYW